MSKSKEGNREFFLDNMENEVGIGHLIAFYSGGGCNLGTVVRIFQGDNKQYTITAVGPVQNWKGEVVERRSTIRGHERIIRV